MNVLVDTPIWSLALRRRAGDLSAPQKRLLAEWERLIRRGQVVMVGPIRQELLSGVREPGVFEKLRLKLRPFEDVPLATQDFEEAARCYNRCRAGGVTGSAVDCLLCAVSIRLGLFILSTDEDFRLFSKHLPIRLHVPRSDGTTRRT